jgi:hypothetical protein
MQTITKEEAKKRGLGRFTDHYKTTEREMLIAAVRQLGPNRIYALVKMRRGIEIWIPATEIKNSRNSPE